MLAAVGLSDDVARIAAAAAAYSKPGETLDGVLAAEPSPGRRTYLCSFVSARRRTWLALDDAGKPVDDRDLVREAISISALCEVAEESAGAGELEELRRHLLSLRLTEAPAGVEEAEDAALTLEQALGTPPRLASPAYLDEVGDAVRRLEVALGSNGASPFAAAMAQALGAVEELAKDVEGNYKLELT